MPEPTPDKPEPLAYVCRTIIVPDEPTVIATIYGQIYEMCQSWFWIQEGTWTVDEITQAIRNGLAVTDQTAECGATLTCEQIIDCFENDPAVMAEVLQQLAANGFAPNNQATPPVPVLTPAQTAENLIPSSADCNDGQLMAIAREIVVKVDRAIVDFFQQIELISDPAEVIAVLSDNVEGISWITTPLEVGAWFQDTLTEIYEGSFTQAVEDNFACAFYCQMVADCEITLDELLTACEGLMGSLMPPPDPDDYVAMFDWLVNLDTSVGTSVVAAFYWSLFNAMRFANGLFPDLTILVDLRGIIAQAVGKTDTSYVDCDDCPPTETPNTYWYLIWDFALGQFITESVSPTTTEFKNSGWEIVSGTTNILSQVKASFGATTYYLAGGRMTSLRRGSNASGTTDYKRINVYPNENVTGTPVQAMNSNFLGDGNAVTGGNLTLADNAFPFKSMNIIEGVSGSFVANVNFARLWKLELWGWNHSNQKPAGSVWVSAIV